MIRRLFAELRPVRPWLILSAVLYALLACAILAQALLLSRAISSVYLGGSTLASVAPLLILLAAAIAARAALTWANTLAAARMAARIKLDLRQRLLAHLRALGPAYLKQERTGDLSLTATAGIDALDAFFRDFVPALFGATLTPLLILAPVLPIDALTFAVLLITAPLIPLFTALIGSAAGSLARRQFALMRRLGAHFLDVMQGLVTLKLFNRSQAQTESIARVTGEFRRATLRVLRVSFLSAFMLEMLATLSIAIVAVEIGLRLLSGNLTFEPALFLLVIAPEFYLPLRALGAKFHAGTQSAAAAAEIYRILDAPLPHLRRDTFPANLTTKAQSTQRGQVNVMNIRFEDVRFAYDEGARPALDGLTLAIEPGQKVALVGASGSGKTTAANLLLRFIAPDTGRITVDGIDLTALDADAWRARVAWVPQSPYLFNTTIAQNIALGKPGASTTEIISAAEAAGAHEFIAQLPQGYDTPCGERGLRLSGGQAQRIAIARALLKDAPLLILDEATASLDPASEATVQAALQRLLRHRTAFVIAHRLNTVVDAGAIYVLQAGRVIEHGTHAELMAHGIAYQRLVQAFAGGQVGK
jgi:ATP-binding cassette, subfamily C, bacterial CydD